MFTTHNSGRRTLRSAISRIAYKTLFLSLCLGVVITHSFAQTETVPAPSASKSGVIPAVKEKRLANGLTVAVVEKHSLPIVTVQLLIKSGASSEDSGKAGLADMTASMLTKGTKTRTATQIAEQVEFLGGTINSGAGWNNSTFSISVTSDKIDQAMAILADVVLNPAFDQKELDLLKSQALDGLTYNLKQPGFLGNYVATKYSFDEHPTGGTPASIASITQSDIKAFHKDTYTSDRAVIIFTGDISLVKAAASTQKLFGRWKEWSGTYDAVSVAKAVTSSSDSPIFNRMLVIDLPNSGQAAVNYVKRLDGVGRSSSSFYPSSVMNSVLGGGYSSRLNQEIRIKRGLSYGAGSSFSWRGDRTNFSTRTQTKNESAAEVVDLVLIELKKLADSDTDGVELVPRKSVLTGGFGRNLETTAGLAGSVADLYSFGITTSELNSYISNVNKVSAKQIREFAKGNLLGGDIVIVGDYAKFKDDLAKRFPKIKVDVIKADDLDMSKSNLRK